jgi:ATP diphosphatase
MRDLLRIMQRLRDPEHGCPWDLAQDFSTIVPSTLEECYELAAAIEAGDYAHVADELGDVLFQVVFYAQLGRSDPCSDFEHIVDGLATKLLRRHPHVFADGEIEGVVEGLDSDSGEAAVGGDQGRRAGRRGRSTARWMTCRWHCRRCRERRSCRSAPRGVGFDWSDSRGVLDKLDEELGELRDAIAARDAAACEDELGDLLFTVVNLARHLKVDAETALRGASGKFERRFRRMEMLAAQRGQSLDALAPDQLEAHWQQAKNDEAP